MTARNSPRFPVYVISKGRADRCLTARFFVEDGVDFRLVVEPQEADAYRANFGDRVVELPFSNLGQGSFPARNWCWEDAKARGAKRHWIFDDNIYRIRRLFRGERLPCRAGIALAAIEDFTERYTNVAISGLNYTMFVTRETARPFALNVHVYSALLILNELPYRWRLRYNEDTDLCLQVLSNGWCTVLFSAFSVDKVGTMTMKGGNSDELYQGRGRLVMARALQEIWPQYVDVKRRFGRPQHVVKENWGQFRTPLRRRPDFDFDALPKVDERGMKLRAAKEVVDPELVELLDD